MLASPATRAVVCESVSSRISPGSARSLLLTLLGEFILPSQKPTWTSPLLSGLAGVGVGEKAARQAIARAAAAGWLESEPNGRRTAWRLTATGRRVIAEGSRRLRALRGDAAPWNGEWLLVHLTLPQSRRDDRLRVYKALSWLGFGNPTPGVWISPEVGRSAEVRRLVVDRKLDGLALAFTARTLDIGLNQRELVDRAWDLEAVARHYEELVDRFGAMRPRTDDEFLHAHIQLVNALQRLPSLDPGLPPELLPPGWAKRRREEKLWSLREAWRVRAHRRWDDLAASAV